MKGRKAKKSPKPSFTLKEKRFSHGKVIEFPQIQGRTIARVQFFTSKDDQCIAIDFDDKTLLSFHLVPGFVLSANLGDLRTGNFRKIKEWPPIHSEPYT
jgi:hypothetical protein